MTEFQELTKNAPNFTSMEHGELVTYAYAMYAAGVKTDTEKAKLRELVNGLTWCCENSGCDNRCPLYAVSEPDHCREQRLKQELGLLESPEEK